MTLSQEERLEFEQAGLNPDTVDRLMGETVAPEFLQRAIREVQEVIGPHGSVSRMQAGGVRVTREGIGVHEDGVSKTNIDQYGNLFVGSDLESPATTSFSVFVSDQPYNGEEMGAGDLLVGDNSADVSNVKWDTSEGQFQFRLGTTVNAYMDTDGSFKVLLGEIGGWVIDADSITADTGTVGMSSATTFGSGDDIRFFAGLTDPEDLASGPFWIDANGNLRADSATITGTITAEDGSIGGWAIEANRLWSDPLGDGGIYLYSDNKKILVGNVAGGTHIIIDGSSANQYIRSSNFVTGASGFNISAATGDAEFNNITARGELKTFLLTSSNQMAVGGNIIVSKDAGKLGADVTAIATTVNFGKAMTVGDWIKIQGPDSTGSSALEAMLVGSLVSGTTYNVTRNVDGSGANAWLKDTPFVVIGQNGTSRIELTAGATGSIQLITQGATYGTMTTQVSLSTALGTMTAGGGDVTIDNGGILFKNQEANLSFEDTSNDVDNIQIYSDGLDFLVLKNAVGGKGIGFDIDDASHSVAQYSFTADGITIGGVSTDTVLSITAGTPTVFNDGGLDIDERHEGATNTRLLHLDGGENQATSFAWNGWQSMEYQTWTRTGDHVFTVSGDVTAVYRKAALVRYKDGGAYEYGVIASSSHSGGTTTVTLITNTSYTMAAATITDNYLCYGVNPEGFPDEFAFTPSGLVTIQNGTQEAYWKTAGNKIYIHGGILYGSTPTTFSSSDLTLPVAIHSSYDISAAMTPLGVANYLDAGTANYLGSVRRQTSTTARFQAIVTSATHGTTTAITSTVPFTWGSTDELSWFIEYLF